MPRTGGFFYAARLKYQTPIGPPSAFWITTVDERGRTASLLVDLVASLMGRRILDRPTRSFR